jgi:hypothetical protein
MKWAARAEYACGVRLVQSEIAVSIFKVQREQAKITRRGELQIEKSRLWRQRNWWLTSGHDHGESSRQAQYFAPIHSCGLRHDAKISRILRDMPHSEFVGLHRSPEEMKTQGQALRTAVHAAISKSATEDWTDEAFNALALAVFRHQFSGNAIYRRWCLALGWDDQRAASLGHWTAAPTMPVEAFKWGEVFTQGTAEDEAAFVFRTSGTTGQTRGEHVVRTPSLYAASAQWGFQRQFGPPGEDGGVLLGMLPGYLERSDSSLVHMVMDLRTAGWCLPGESPEQGFFLDDFDGLFKAIDAVLETQRFPVLMGVTWALVDAAEAWSESGRGSLPSKVRVVETGGMKGRRKEWVREEVHTHLMGHFGCPAIFGEYGMTELLSQAWSSGQGQYVTPPWMRIRIRRTDDPLSLNTQGATGGLDVVDLANLGSCSFLSTQDLVRPIQGHENRGFEVLGRFDHSEVRGCNLMVL